MTITISHQSSLELCHEFQQTPSIDPSDPRDITWQYPSLIGLGYTREIELTQGLSLEIFEAQLQDRLLVKMPEIEEPELHFHFHLLGYHQDFGTIVSNREFALYGTGISPQQIQDGPAQTALEVFIDLHPERLLSCLGAFTGELPQELQHLIKPSDQKRYARVGKITPVLEAILWQILRCPFQGITKRMYLEGKALELISWIAQEEIVIQTGRQSPQPLEKDILDRLYYAKTLLLENLNHPLSSAELAKLVQLNEYTLKRGFKQLFNSSVFDYVRDHRLNRAKQLLETGQMGVTQVMKAVGYRDRHHFAKAFREKFKINPRSYLKHHKL